MVERRKLGRELFAAIRGFDVLQELLEDKRITEIMVNGPDRIFIEKDGRLTQWQGRFESPARLLDVIQQIAAVATGLSMRRLRFWMQGFPMVHG